MDTRPCWRRPSSTPRALRDLLPGLELALAELHARLCPRRRRPWRHHGQPKEVFVFELTDGAAQALSRVDMPAHSVEQHTEPMAAPRLRSLFECLGEVPECRFARGKRFRSRPCWRSPSRPGLPATGGDVVAQFAALLSQEQLEAVGAFWSESKQRYTAPATCCRPKPSGHRPVDRPARHRARACRHAARPSKQTEDGRRMMVAALEHDSGGRLQEQRDPGRARALQQPRPRRPHRHRRCDARPARDRALSARAPRRLRDQGHQGQPGNHLEASRRSTATRPGTKP